MRQNSLHVHHGLQRRHAKLNVCILLSCKISDMIKAILLLQQIDFLLCAHCQYLTIVNILPYCIWAGFERYFGQSVLFSNECAVLG